MKIGFVGVSLSHPDVFTAAIHELDLAEVAGVWAEDNHQETLRKCAKKHGLYICGSAEEVIDTCDAVVVTTETYHHKDYALRVLEAGKPVFVDKPMTTCYADAAAIVDKAKSAGATMMSCSVYRCAPAFHAIAAAVRDGQAGKPISATVFVPHGVHPGGWQDRVETSGGLIFNFGIHAVDVLQSALGPEPEEVNCFAGKLDLPDVDSHDAAVIQVRFAGGAVGTAEVIGCMHAGEKMATAPAMRVFGMDNSLHARLDESGAYQYAGGRFGVSPYYSMNTGVHDTMKAFFSMIESGRPAIPYDEMLASIAILDAARRSAAENRRVSICEVTA